MSTDLSKEQKAELCFKLVQDLRKAAVSTMMGYLSIGKTLSQINDQKLYGYYGEHIRTFRDFLKEIRLKHSTAYNCMAIWQKFAQILIDKKIEADYFRLVKLLPVYDRLGDVEEWLRKAQDLPSQEFDNEILVLKGGVDSNACFHAGPAELYVRCDTCKKFIKQTPQEMEARIQASRILKEQNEIQKQQGEGNLL